MKSYHEDFNKMLRLSKNYEKYNVSLDKKIEVLENRINIEKNSYLFLFLAFWIFGLFFYQRKTGIEFAA